VLGLQVHTTIPGLTSSFNKHTSPVFESGWHSIIFVIDNKRQKYQELGISGTVSLQKRLFFVKRTVDAFAVRALNTGGSFQSCCPPSRP
jgi:hypothetical protein